MTNPPPDYFADRSELDGWMKTNPTVLPEGNGLVAENLNLSGLDLEGAKFQNSELTKPNFKNTSLINAHFGGATWHGGDYEGVELEGIRFPTGTLIDVDLSKANGAKRAQLSGATWDRVVATGLHLERANFRHGLAKACRFHNTHFDGVECLGKEFRFCDFSGASFRGAELSNTTWRGCTIDSHTVFDYTIWRPDHDSPNDGAAELKLPWYRWFLNWEVIRIIGRVPLFSGSYVLLSAALFAATAIAWVNDSEFIGSITTYPVPYPPRVVSLLLGSALLAAGTTFFEVGCPARVKEFSFVGWVENLKRPGILYKSDTLKKPLFNLFALILSSIGGVILGWLFVERLWAAFGAISAAASVTGTG